MQGIHCIMVGRLTSEKKRNVEVTKSNKATTTRAGERTGSYQNLGAQSKSPEGQVLRSLKAHVTGMRASTRRLAFGMPAEAGGRANSIAPGIILTATGQEKKKKNRMSLISFSYFAISLVLSVSGT